MPNDVTYPNDLPAEQVEQLYYSSPHVSFRAFCESAKWDDEAQYQKHIENVKSWEKSKKRKLLEKQAAALGEAVFSAQNQWHKDVLYTVKEYAKTADIIQRAIDLKARQLFADAEDNPGEVDPCKLTTLAQAQKIITEAKKSALIIDKYSVAHTKEYVESIDNRSDEAIAQTWRVVCKGSSADLSAEDLEKRLMSFYDPKQDDSDDILIDVSGEK